MTDADSTGVNRGIMALVGAVAGAAAWYFVEIAEDVMTNPRLYLFSVTAVMGFFAILLGLKGPLGWARAALGAAALALLAAGLIVWASLRFDDLETFFDTPLHVLALFLLLFIGTPFISAGLQRRGGARNYALLFDTAWALLVRYLAGWLFVAVVWGIVYLSDTLLRLVGVTVIQDLIGVDPVPFALTGLFLGLALAVMHELREYISPFLVLRLFRILLPAVVVVVGVFLIALVLRGMVSLIGNLSVAATLMAVAIAAITLITSSMDRADEEAAQVPLMAWSARIMSGMLVPLTLAAAWCVWLRVEQYGWTPDRVAAALSALVLVVYALAYGVSVLRAGWGGRIRQVNLGMALAVLALSVLWLTPAIHAEAISTRSQIARFEAGRLEVARLPLWNMKDGWGRAGTAGLARLRALAEAGTHPEAEALQARLARLNAADTRYDFERMEGPEAASPADVETVLGALVVLPEGQNVSRDDLAALPAQTLKTVRRGCALGGEEQPGCVLVLTDLKPFEPGEEGVFLVLQDAGARVEVMSVRREEAGLSLVRSLFADLTGVQLRSQVTALKQAMASGDIRIVPTGIDMIAIGGVRILP